MEFIKAKNILFKVNYGNSWYGVDYNMNLYKGCSHGCIYCDSRSSCYGIENFDIVRSKENALEILENELRHKRKKGIVGIGSMSDTYNPLEEKYEITKGALELIAQYGFGVAIDTKSHLILRDLPLLQKIKRHNDVIVKFTVTTPHDSLAKIIEPHVCPTSQRLAAIKTLNENNIFAGIMLNPVLPFITDSPSDIKKLVWLAHQSQAKFIHTYMGMTLRANQRDHYYKMLDKHFPGLKAKYIAAYDDNYSCAVPNYQSLYKIFAEECTKYGILYEMPQIIQGYQTHNGCQQLSLFNLE